jgi:bifunctional N-acetylglucosamine-1-phosphate-uridyltransferase/glucosamine-1-phosphate-acetyltransferase GlmU-like protein
MKAADFFTLPRSLAPFLAAFQPDAPPWEWLKQISVALAARRMDPSLKLLPPGAQAEGWVYVHPSVKIRGNVIVGEGCVLGNSCEFKNCLLMDSVQVPHFNYVGDSILGNGVHLGAGAILSNFRLDQQPIVLHLPDLTVETGLRKFGAILGDRAEVGCNAVLQPGTLLGPRALVMPAMAFGGWLPPKTIAKTRQVITTIERRD